MIAQSRASQHHEYPPQLLVLYPRVANSVSTPRLKAVVPSIDFNSLAAPLNLANSPCLHLLTAPEQALCSSLRIYPKPYLVVKEILVREYARRGGKLRRREARDLVKIDVNKTSRVWDFLVQAGYLKINSDIVAAGGSQAADARYVPPTLLI